MTENEAHQVLTAATDRLTDRMQSLVVASEEAFELRDELVVLDQEGKAAKRRVFLLFFVLILLGFYLIGFGAAVWGQVNASNEQEALITKLDDTQLLQRSRGLCAALEYEVKFGLPRNPDGSYMTLEQMKVAFPQYSESELESLIALPRAYAFLHCSDFSNF